MRNGVAVDENQLLACGNEHRLIADFGLAIALVRVPRMVQ
jgi:hypothetical protein